MSKNGRQGMRGRGAASNPKNRFEPLEVELDPEDEDESVRPLRTQFFEDGSESVVTYNNSPDLPFSASVNPYRGCEHGCSYCYARPFHEYLGFSAGLDFESKIMVKPRAPELLRRELAAKRWKPQLVALSGVTDPYQPIEKKLEITRRCLEVMRDFRNPVGIVTKNRLVARDKDILGEMAKRDLCSVSFSINTLDAELARKMEPRTSSPEARLSALGELARCGVPVGVFIAPVIPGLNDHEIAEILKRAKECGARYATYILLRLPHGVEGLFLDWLEAVYPNRKDKVVSRMRDVRGGTLNRSAFGERFSGRGLFAEQIRQLFQVSLKRVELDCGPPPLTIEHFRNPEDRQLDLGLL